MSPPGVSNAESTPHPGQQIRESQRDRSAYLSEKTLVREGHKVSIALGCQMSRKRVRHLVQQFLDTGRSDIDFRTWFIAYADPTGEAAVRNVMREERAR